MEQLTGNVVRISIGHFPSEQTEKISYLLNNDFKDTVVPAIEKLNGLIKFYTGIDKEKLTLTNVSFWQTVEDAKQMNTLKEMLDSRVIFEAVGVKFMDIPNNTILWEI